MKNNMLKHHRVIAERGAAILLMVLLFTLGSLVVTMGVSRGVYEDVVSTRALLDSRQSFYTAESGVEDAIYRHLEAMSIGTTEVITVGSTTATTTITTLLAQKRIDTTASLRSLVRKLSATIRIGNGASFNFGLQSDVGGITMNNSSSVSGNAYSNGTITGGGSSMIYGDVISAGSSGLITGIHATGSAWSNRIQNSTVNKNAYYQSISSTVVGGISYPGSIDQATTSLPIEESLIDEWKTHAEAGGTISGPCPYTINADATIGPVKVACDMVITGNNTDVTLMGPIWVEGNLTMEKANFYVDSSLGPNSVQMIVDDPDSHATGSKITVSQSTSFFDEDGGSSYVLLLSRNDSARTGGSETAINLTQSANGKVLVYAADGKINLANSVSMKEVTGYHIVLGNNTNVSYETGLASLLFSGGPGGSYIITNWGETQ